MASKAEESHRGEKKHNFTMIQFFEWYSEGGGVHWNKYKDMAPRLASMGITAAWLPPPTKGSTINGTGYDIYDLWDLGEFLQKDDSERTNWGRKEELLAAIKAAKDNGIISYIDAVLNHKLGADGAEEFLATQVDADNRTQDVGEPHNIEGWTKYDFEGRGGKYSEMKWNFNHFTGVDYDNKTQTNEIFRIMGEGKYWAENVDNESNYDFLMGSDIDHAHPDVRKDLNAWGDWVLKETGASGFRFDAIKHIDETFISQFVKHVRKEAKNENLFCVGEFWKDSLDDIEGYLERLQTQFSIFDAPLHYNFKEAAESGANYDLRKIFDETIVQRRPIDAVTLVDNHDTQVDQSLESWVGSGFKPLAYSLILMRPSGYPCVFLGDLVGCRGEHPQEPVSQLEDMIRARKLFAYGECHDYWDHANCVGWVRTGDKDHPEPCAVVICNGSEGMKKMEIGKDHAGEKWTDLLGWHGDELVIGEDGWCEFKCSAESVSIWTKTDAKGREEFGKEDPLPNEAEKAKKALAEAAEKKKAEEDAKKEEEGDKKDEGEEKKE